MKLLIPILTLFLSACSVHNHRYDAEQDAYYEEDYYAYDNYDPYYGYGSSEYSYAGDGVYYNNYNYYPDRWGVTYSNVYYSPFRYPRVGFYYSSINHCGYSYWSRRCFPSYWPGYLYSSAWWPSFGFGIGYSSYYYDNYWWYNHWRNRNNYYDNYHYKPTQSGYYSARNEARRLNNNRHYSRYKEDRPVNTRYYNKPQAVSRGRSSSNRSVNRTTHRSAPVNTNKPMRSSKPTHRGRQQADVINQNRQNNAVNHSQSVRSEVLSHRTPTNNQSNLQQRIQQQHNNQSNQRSRYQKPAAVNNSNQNRQVTNRVKPMSSQSPVYHTNRTVKPNVTVQNNRRDNSPRVVNRNTHRPMVQRSASTPQANRPVSQSKPARSNRSSSKPTGSRSSSEKSSSSSNRSTSSRSSSGNRSVSRSRDQR